MSQGDTVLLSYSDRLSWSLLDASSLSLKVDPIIFQVLETDLQGLHIPIVTTST